MPAVSAVPVQLAVNAIKKYIKYFQTDKLPEHSSKVWQDISDELKGLWKVSAVRVNIQQDRRKILTLAREECGIFISGKEKITPNLNESTESHDNSNTKYDLDDSNRYDGSEKLDSDASDDDAECESFHVTISREQWNQMKCKKPLIYKGRKYYGFEPGVWTNIVSQAFWEQYRIKCAFVFKRAKINKNGRHYAVMNGRCKDSSCRNSIRGIIKDPPLGNGPVVIIMKCRDTRSSKHADVKRPLNGKKRNEIKQTLLRTGVLGWIKEEAKNILQPGDTGSPFLYNPNTLHQAKKEATNEELGINPEDGRDLILAIRKMNQDPMYTNSISWIGDTPFFVFYVTPTQLHTYAEYMRIHKQCSSICIDATGGLVKRLIESRDKKTGHIFLYQVIINFDGTSIPVYQMLSEKHSARFISFWLSEWVDKVQLPRQAVSDGSRALLNAMSLAFNGKSLKDYINFVFENLINSTNVQPRTFIRLDTAHFLHSVSRWKCFLSVLHKIVKQFFLYCVALMIDCQQLSLLEEFFILTLIVCNSEFDDSIIALDDRMISAEEARKKLEELIAKRNFDLTVIDSIEIDPEKTVILEELSSKAVDKDGCSVSLLTWIDRLCRQVNNVIFIGKKLNTHYVPGLYSNLVDKIKDFPLWTNVCTPETMSRPTSCYVETNFKDLKMNLKNKVKLPTTVTKFLKLHIADILGGVNIFRAKLTKFVVENSSDENQKYPKEEKLYENWKGLGKTTRDDDWISNYGNQSDKDDQNDSLAMPENHSNSFSNINSSKDKNYSVTKFENHYDHNYSLNFKDNTKNYNINISATNVEDLTIVAKNSTNDRKIISITSPSTVHNDLNLSSSSMSSSNYPDENKSVNLFSNSYEKTNIEDRITHEPFTLKQDGEPLFVALENMMKEKSMNKKVGHYFKCCPEAALLNNLVNEKKPKVIKKRQDFLLRNGNKTGPVKFKGTRWTALNTCAFDTLAQILFTAAIDNNSYNEFITNSDLPIFKFVKYFIKFGATQGVYENRMSILNPIYAKKNIEKDNTKIEIAPKINCTDNITKLWNILFKDKPSAIESTVCSNSLCRVYTRALPSITANHKIITRQGFTALERALEFYHQIYNVHCRFCYKPIATCFTVPQQSLFIELDIRDNQSKVKMCRLSELPIHLNLKLKNDDGSEAHLRYRLSGVVAYVTGHYLAYCRRVGGNWEMYNDLSTKPESASGHVKVEPHGAFYILESHK
ncbi:unnamed protein product [Euphydryas editha]|uniref:USP domain-containing protein n=1 Tax=Euphydryas editha TaxID=104508 RepID=A0AAU9THP6_EUPED|nr:unnamed protein product [Euphydryas editha]